MRSLNVIAEVLVLLILLGCSVSQQATVPTNPVAAQDATLTLDQAVALIGTPTQERQCQDGGRILTWKVAKMAPHKWPHGPYAVAADPVAVRTIAAQPAVFAEQATTLVIKFDAGGRMLWAREFLR